MLSAVTRADLSGACHAGRQGLRAGVAALCADVADGGNWGTAIGPTTLVLSTPAAGGFSTEEGQAAT